MYCSNSPAGTTWCIMRKGRSDERGLARPRSSAGGASGPGGSQDSETMAVLVTIKKKKGKDKKCVKGHNDNKSVSKRLLLAILRCFFDVLKKKLC